MIRRDWFEPEHFANGVPWSSRSAFAALPHLSRVASARRVMGQMDDDALEAIAEAAIGLLDERAGDPDLEDSHDAEQEGVMPGPP